jgi:hypothetical protein
MKLSQENAPKTFSRATRRQRLIAGIVLLSIIGFFAACWVIARYEIPIYPFGCGFKQRYGLPCPTCGMTTAVLAFAQGRIINSFYIQPAAAFLCSIAVVAAFFAFLTAVFGIYSPALERRLASLKIRYIVAGLLFVLAVGWAVTLVRAIAK